MPEKKPRVEWASNRTVFAEAAEAAGINTDQIMGTTPYRDIGLMVLWTDGFEDDAPIMGTVIYQDDDDVFHVWKSGPTGSTIGDWKRKLEADMKAKLGPFGTGGPLSRGNRPPED